MKPSVSAPDTMHHIPLEAMQAIETLHNFLDHFDSGNLFNSTDPVHYRKLRKNLLAALSTLLVWDRPLLETTLGCLWPYNAFRKRAAEFEKLALNHNHAWVRRQAKLFLALLPFPGQWQWLLQFEKQPLPDPEIKALLHSEKLKIHAKLMGKKQKRFKLRHFCQVLKKPRLPDEKGVLRIFSLPYLLINPHLLQALNRFYVFYIEPPMGIVYRHTWWRYFSNLEDPCLFGVGSEEDALFLGGQPGIITTDLAHGDFLDHTADVNLTSKAAYDIVFNATFDDMPRKRHTLMLELLRHPLLSSKNALFLGRGNKKNIDAFKQQIAENHLTERVTVLSNLRRSEIPDQLARCRIGVHLSLYENACRGIYEFFRSDRACVISSSMGGMNQNIFHDRTGMAVPDSKLPETISRVLQHAGEFSPRAWFLNHSGSDNSTRKLNQCLKILFERQGYEWKEDIVPLTSSGASRYLHLSDYMKFRPEFEWILSCFERHIHLPISLTIE